MEGKPGQESVQSLLKQVLRTGSGFKQTNMKVSNRIMFTFLCFSLLTFFVMTLLMFFFFNLNCTYADKQHISSSIRYH